MPRTPRCNVDVTGSLWPASGPGPQTGYPIPHRVRDAFVAPDALYDGLSYRLAESLSVLVALALASGIAMMLFWSSHTGERIQRSHQESALTALSAQLGEAEGRAVRRQIEAAQPTPVRNGVVSAAAVVLQTTMLAFAAHIILRFLLARPDVPYTAVFSVFAHASPLLVARTLTSLVVMLVSGAQLSGGPLSVMLGPTGSDADPVWLEVVRRVDPIQMWWLVVVSLGLSRLYNLRRLRCAGALLTIGGLFLIASVVGHDS
jgi:hypothetical protein